MEIKQETENTDLGAENAAAVENEGATNDDAASKINATAEGAADGDDRAARRKLDRWIEKLLDTGKRNNLINFKDSKYTSAELVVPDAESVFSKREVGHSFVVFDPKIPEEPEDELDETPVEASAPSEAAPAAEGDESVADGTSSAAATSTSPAAEASASEGETSESAAARASQKEEFVERFSSKIRGANLLFYSAKVNPIVAVKGVAKKARELLDETGVSAAYLAFGFVRWNDKGAPDVTYRAPLLLVHVDVAAGSVLDPVKIQISDDDVVVNPTFNYKLQTEFGAELPPFGDDDTLTSYLAKVSEIVGKLGWDVVPECKLGIFSFLKLAMYEDLKNNADKLLKNDVVKALVGLSAPQKEKPESESEPEKSPVANPLVDLHTVVDADASQMKAVEMAKSGKSFVLQGPPGTGKSQTITNIIAECLYDGKKVLFVSEKQAALNVVFDKLDKVGLEDFCLELHSFKANKKAVIEELVQTLETKRTDVADGADAEINEKRAALKQLDDHVAALHKRREPLGLSVFQVLERYSALRETPEVELALDGVATKTNEQLLDATRLLDEFAGYAPVVGDDYRHNPWHGFVGSELTSARKDQLQKDCAALAERFETLKPVSDRFHKKYKTATSSYGLAQRLREHLVFLADSDFVVPKVLKLERERLGKAADAAAEIRTAKSQLLQNFQASILAPDIDGKSLHDTLSTKFKSFFARLFSGDYRKLAKELRSRLKTGGSLKYDDMVKAAGRIETLQTSLKSFEETAPVVKDVLGAAWKGPESDWDVIASALKTLHSVHDDLSETLQALAQTSDAEYQAKRAEFRRDADELNAVVAPCHDALETITAQFDDDSFNFRTKELDVCLAKLRGIPGAFDKFGTWRDFTGVLRRLDEASLRQFVDAALDAKTSDGRKTRPDETADAYRKLFYRRWLDAVIGADPELASFTRVRQDQAVDIFTKKDRRQYDLSKAQIRAKLSHERPNLEQIAAGGAVAFLRREGQKKRKQASVRKLLETAGELIQTLKPCFLMSPLSVSSLIDPKTSKIEFDVVIFDEASQVFPQDALGAIYRAKQLIVVGDSKQMPPTNFFNAAIESSEDDEEDEVADFESILDVCGASFPSERLSWHYRSRYEQLIAFSNVHFYDGTLSTFPSATADCKGIGVDHYFVEKGVFDRKTKTNRVEAEAVVDLVFQNIAKYPDRSLGVVAFSNAQQKLIDRLISKRREQDPTYETFFRDDAPAPFFVKNLESVQGDERDAIIFSVAYAKDAAGRFIQNFGPLNREGGERRLNVAITRAKKNVQLVSSIRFTDINLSGTKSLGVKLLHDYLNYAQNGAAALERPKSETEQEPSCDALEKEIAAFLGGAGYEVDQKIGCSSKQVELGVRPKGEADYIMAIECDGATYRALNNARDRECTRRSVLSGMGWGYYRIWATEWFKNNATEKQRLLQAVADAAQKAQARKEGKKDAPVKPDASAAAPDQPLNGFEVAASDQGRGFDEYREVDALKIVEKHGVYFKRAIREILETEAPLAEDALLKRIAPFFGGKSLSKRVAEEFDIRMAVCEQDGIVRRDGFLFLQGQTEFKLRVPGEKRDVKYVALEELAAGLRSLIEENAPIEKDGLYKTLASLLGASRTANVVARFDEALASLVASGAVVEEEGALKLRRDAN